MIVPLSSLEELYKKIEEDRNIKGYPNVNRFPVRFIHLNSFKELHQVLEFLTKEYNVKYKDISELLYDDNWLTSYDIVEEIKRIDENTVVVSLSEFLRFEEDLFPTLKGLTEIERQDIRIYIPLVGIWERFEREFWNKFYRREEWVPVWRLETPTQRSITLYLIDFNLNYSTLSLKDFIVVPSAKEWLSIWKRKITEDKKGVLLISKPLSYLYKNFLPDSVFDLKKISNGKEFLERIFRVKVPVEYREEDVEFWNKLIEDVDRSKKGTTLESIFLEHFNLGSLDRLKPIDFLELYLKTNDNYKRWLVKNLFLSLDKFRSSYLYICFEKLRRLEKRDLIEIIWLEIFNLPSETLDNILSERREFLNYTHRDLKFSPEFIEEKLSDKLNVIKNLPIKKKFKYLTGITFVEKKYIIYELKNLDIQDIQKIIPDLKEVYPELAYYLDWDLVKPDNDIESWIIEYFREYNYSKLKNVKSPKIEELINTKNRDRSTFLEWYYSIPKADLDRDCECFWVDGLGAEWFPLIVHLIDRYRDKGKFIKKKLITRVNLPSITKCNRYEGKRIEDLDRYIHQQHPYRYPDDLINEIEIVKNVVKKIMDSPSEKICIVSDHGFTFLCTKNFGNIKRLDISNSEHEGRYTWVEGENYSDDTYYILWKVDEGHCQGKTAIVALKHVSLGDTPYREVHGGATPEEVLVPYILIETEKGDETEYSVEVINPEIWITNPVLEFKINPQPTSIPETFLNKKPLKVSYNREGDIYSIDLRDLKVGKYRIQLKIGNKEYHIEVSIRGGFKERDLL